MDRYKFSQIVHWAVNIVWCFLLLAAFFHQFFFISDKNCTFGGKTGGERENLVWIQYLMELKAAKVCIDHPKNLIPPKKPPLASWNPAPPQNIKSGGSCFFRGSPRRGAQEFPRLSHAIHSISKPLHLSHGKNSWICKLFWKKLNADMLSMWCRFRSAKSREKTLPIISKW